MKGLKKLRRLTKIPDVLLSIMNEVADLTLVIQDIRLNYQGSYSISSPSVSITTQLLDRARDTLLELDQVINYRLLKSSKLNGELTFSRSAWLVEEHRVQSLQASLRTTRLDIAALSLYVLPLLYVTAPWKYRLHLYTKRSISSIRVVTCGPGCDSMHRQPSPLNYVLTWQVCYRISTYTHRAAFDLRVLVHLLSKACHTSTQASANGAEANRSELKTASFMRKLQHGDEGPRELQTIHVSSRLINTILPLVQGPSISKSRFRSCDFSPSTFKTSSTAHHVLQRFPNKTH